MRFFLLFGLALFVSIEDISDTLTHSKLKHSTVEIHWCLPTGYNILSKFISIKNSLNGGILNSIGSVKTSTLYLNCILLTGLI